MGDAITHVVEFFVDAEVAGNGDAFEVLEVVVGPGEAQRNRE
jgi:hypothetical protein